MQLVHEISKKKKSYLNSCISITTMNKTIDSEKNIIVDKKNVYIFEFAFALISKFVHSI